MDEFPENKSAITKAVKEGSFGWIQWKGTEVCVDIHCKRCGESTHFDGDFMYQIECGNCGALYQCNPHIELIEIDESQRNGVDPRISETATDLKIKNASLTTECGVDETFEGLAPLAELKDRRLNQPDLHGWKYRLEIPAARNAEKDAPRFDFEVVETKDGAREFWERWTRSVEEARAAEEEYWAKIQTTFMPAGAAKAALERFKAAALGFSKRIEVRTLHHIWEALRSAEGVVYTIELREDDALSPTLTCYEEYPCIGCGRMMDVTEAQGWHPISAGTGYGLCEVCHEGMTSKEICRKVLKLTDRPEDSK
jgi:hypothetical protein